MPIDPIGPRIQPLQWPTEKPFEQDIRTGPVGFSPYDSISSATVDAIGPQTQQLEPSSAQAPVLSKTQLRQLHETNQLLEKISQNEQALAETDFEILKLLCHCLSSLKESQEEKGRQAVNRILKEKELVRDRWKEEQNTVDASKNSKWWVRLFNWMTLGTLTISGGLFAAGIYGAWPIALTVEGLTPLIGALNHYLYSVLALSQTASTAGRAYFSDKTQKLEKKLLQTQHDRTIAKVSIDAKIGAVKKAQEKIAALVQKQSEAQQQFWQAMQQHNRE